MVNHDSDSDSRNSTVLLSQFKIYMEIYQHHFDLYIKAVAIYLAVVGAVATYIFQGQINVSAQIALSLFVVLVSGGSVVGGYFAKRWVGEIGCIVNSITSDLSTEKFPFSGAEKVVATIMALSAVLGAGGLLNIVALVY